jgi:hypothetical protein
MADLSNSERRTLEHLFQMHTGYVLNFSNRTFQEFVFDSVRRDIDDSKYEFASNSKANRLRRFWVVEPNLVVGTLVDAMIDHAATFGNARPEQISAAKRVVARLKATASVQEIDAIQPLTDDRTFEALARSIRDAIENNEPENGLDRLHTYIVKYVRTRCEALGIDVERSKPLHSIFGEYVKELRSRGVIESTMTERILKSSLSTLEAFNFVRNNQSLAHDNPMLNYDESLLIYNNVCATVRFLESLEANQRLQSQAMPASAVW